MYFHDLIFMNLSKNKFNRNINSSKSMEMLLLATKNDLY